MVPFLSLTSRKRSYRRRLFIRRSQLKHHQTFFLYGVIVAIIYCFIDFDILSSSSRLCVLEVNAAPKSADSVRPRSFPYIYATIQNFNASYPVIDHIHSDHRYDGNSNDQYEDVIAINNNSTGSTSNRPDFLFSNNTNHTYRIVEFYVHWCDVCKNFKPQYVQLGQRIQDLINGASSSTDNASTTSSDTTATTIEARPTVEIYAVSCAPNRDLCRSLGIDQYPFFRIYRPGDCSSSSCHSDGIDIPHAQINPTTIVQQMGIQLQAVRDFDDDDTATPTTYNLQPMIHQPYSNNTTHAASWLEWSKRLILFLGPSNNSLSSVSTNRSNDDGNIHQNKYQRTHSQDELRDDIHASFDYAMRYAVFVETVDMPLGEERATVLNDWLHLLLTTLPISYTSLRACIKSLIDHYDYVKRSEAYMISILDEYPPPTIEVWSTSCSYGIIDNGYTCGVWLLLHTITIGMVDHNRNVAFIHHRVATMDVANAIRNYINTFFQCEICRHHFVTMYDGCNHNRCNLLQTNVSNHENDWIQLPLWLLETHNAVNVRLLQEKRQRDNVLSIAPIISDDIQSVIWPLRRDCPNCWLDVGNIDDASTTTAAKRKNDDMMYKYLKVVYGQRDAVYIQYIEEIQADLLAVQSLESVTAAKRENHDVNHVTITHWKTIKKYILASVNNLRFHIGMIHTLDDREVEIHRFIVREMMINVYTSHDDKSEGMLPLSDMKSTIVIEWLQLLRKTLPVSWYRLHELIDELLNNWAYVSKSKDYLFAIVSEYPPPDNTSNKGISSLFNVQKSDETNTFLDLLHVISVGFIQYNKYVVSSDEDRLLTGNVVDIIRKYIDHVFSSSSSTEVTTNVTRTIMVESINSICSYDDTCEARIPGTEKDWIALPMWMFRVRNDILERSNSIVADRWPSAAECRTCWIVSHDTYRWNDDYVYKYVLLLYGPESTLGVGIRTEMFGPSVWENLISSMHYKYSLLTMQFNQPVTLERANK